MFILHSDRLFLLLVIWKKPVDENPVFIYDDIDPLNLAESYKDIMATLTELMDEVRGKETEMVKHTVR